jgi:hypothetical protein
MPLRRAMCSRIRSNQSPSRDSSQEGADGGDAWPVSQVLDQPFLAAMGQDVAQPLDLGRLCLADGDGLVPAPPELLAPAGPTDRLRGRGWS